MATSNHYRQRFLEAEEFLQVLKISAKSVATSLGVKPNLKEMHALTVKWHNADSMPIT